MTLVVCLSSALQRTLWFKSFIPSQVNRCSKVVHSVGGKGANVARVLGQLDQPSRLLTFLGGEYGDRTKRLLVKEGISYTAIDCQSETRICSTLIDLANESQTELVEESAIVTSEEVERLWQTYEKQLSNIDYVVISGSAPLGVPVDLYSEMIILANQKAKKTILDAQRDLLARNLAAKPWIAKPNLSELKTAIGADTSNMDTLHLASELVDRGAQNAFISDGAAGVWCAGGVSKKFKPPTLNAVNAIGSGDAMAAGIITADLRRETLSEAIRYGVACGAANVLTPLAGNVRKQDVARILPQVTVEDV